MEFTKKDTNKQNGGKIDYKNPNFAKTISSCWMVLTENCNLRCTYCFEAGCEYANATMSDEMAFKTVDMLIKNVVDAGLEEFNITFFGGEPTLVPELCTRIMDYAIAEGNKYNKKPTFYIITNATIFNDKLEAFYDHWYEVTGSVPGIQLSIDGCPEIQNINRPCTNPNLKSSDLVEAAVAKYLDYFNRRGFDKSRICIHSVTSKKSLPYLFKSMKYFYEVLHINRIDLAWCIEDDWDDNDMMILDEQVSKIVDVLGNITTSKDRFPFKTFEDGCSGCSTGRTLCTVVPNGDIYPCHRFYFYTKHDKDNKIKFGNIMNEVQIDESLREKYINTKACDVTSENCQICYATNYEMTGDMMKLWDKFYGVKIMKILNYHKKYFDAIMDKRAVENLLKAHEQRITKLENALSKYEYIENGDD